MTACMFVGKTAAVQCGIILSCLLACVSANATTISNEGVFVTKEDFRALMTKFNLMEQQITILQEKVAIIENNATEKCQPCPNTRINDSIRPHTIAGDNVNHSTQPSTDTVISPVNYSSAHDIRADADHDDSKTPVDVHTSKSLPDTRLSFPDDIDTPSFVSITLLFIQLTSFPDQLIPLSNVHL